MADPLSFAALLRAARARRGLDLEAAARASGCSESYISLIETGKRLPSEELAVRLARALGIDPTAALLALVRARLPESQRSVLDPAALVREPAIRLAVLRQALGAQLRLRAADMCYEAALDAEGGAEVSIRVTGLEPLSGAGPAKELVLQDPLGFLPVKPRILEAPRGLHYEYDSAPGGGGLVHAIVFPEGWTEATPGRLSFEIRHHRPQAFALDVQTALEMRSRVARNHALRWAAPAFVPVLLDALSVAVRFPPGCEPHDLVAWAWLGGGPLEAAPDNLIDVETSRAHRLERSASRFELTVFEPLPLYSYALAWTPPDRTDRIDARARR